MPAIALPSMRTKNIAAITMTVHSRNRLNDHNPNAAAFGLATAETIRLPTATAMAATSTKLSAYPNTKFVREMGRERIMSTSRLSIARLIWKHVNNTRPATRISRVETAI